VLGGKKNVKPRSSRGFCIFTGVFEGCFGKSALLAVVFRWCNRGGMRGKRGRKTVAPASLKNAPRISTLIRILMATEALALWRFGDQEMTLKCKTKGGESFSTFVSFRSSA
jgi:hypothetical protein